jgi:hypothetical protein
MSAASRRRPDQRQNITEISSLNPSVTAGSGDDVTDMQELQGQRRRLIEEKQKEAARVMDKHDNLVCSL